MDSPVAAARDTPVALSIATSDSGAGAGLQADLKAFTARGVFGTTVFCCLTAQNPEGVTAVETLPLPFIEAQLERIFSWFTVGAIKTGMLFSEPIIAFIAEALASRPEISLVIDPVMVATSGAVLLQPEAIETLKAHLLPRATLITPNLDEAGVLLGERPRDRKSMKTAAAALAERYNTGILLKGGHLEDANEIIDILQLPGREPRIWMHPWLPGVNTHGSGCTLSAAITAELARGQDLETAVDTGLHYLQTALRRPVLLNGEPFIGH